MRIKLAVFAIMTAIAITAMAGVLSGKTIVLDPGHGGFDIGATGPTGLAEKWVNLQVAADLEKLLELQGADVVLTRSTDVFVPLDTRIEIANKKKADLFICIHHNSIQNAPEVDRPQAYYWSATDTSKTAAGTFLKAFEGFFSRPGDLMRMDYEVLRLAKVPAILVESSFISSPERERWLRKPSNLWREALVYDSAALEYFENQSTQHSS